MFSLIDTFLFFCCLGQRKAAGLIPRGKKNKSTNLNNFKTYCTFSLVPINPMAMARAADLSRFNRKKKRTLLEKKKMKINFQNTYDRFLAKITFFLIVLNRGMIFQKVNR